MPPTICVAEFPMTGTTVSTYVRRRQNLQNNGVKRRTFALERMLLRTMTIIEVPGENCLQGLKYTNSVPNCSIPDKNRKHSMSTDEHCRRFVAARKDLMNIVIRTIILVRRNRILQRRLNALRAETRRFLRSVLKDPEDQCQQQRLQMPSYSEDDSEDEIVSSSTEKAISTLSSLPDHVPIRNSFHGVTCDNCDHIDDESSSSDKSEDSSKSEC